MPLDIWHSSAIRYFLLQLPVVRYCILHIPKASLSASDVSGTKIPQETSSPQKLKKIHVWVDFGVTKQISFIFSSVFSFLFFLKKYIVISMCNVVTCVLHLPGCSETESLGLDQGTQSQTLASIIFPV